MFSRQQEHFSGKLKEFPIDVFVYERASKDKGFSIITSLLCTFNIAINDKIVGGRFLKGTQLNFMACHNIK